MTAWKVGEVDNFPVRIKLDIPKDAIVRMDGKKGRTDKAWVDEITTFDGKEHFEECDSDRDSDSYEVGEMSYSRAFRFSPGEGPGIHFYTDEVINA